MPTLDLTPQDLDLRLYIGDDPLLQLTTYTDSSKTQTFDYTGYSGWASQIKAPDGTVAAFTIDSSDQANGVVTIELNGEQIRGFPKRGSRWDIRVTDPDGREISLMQGRVILQVDVTP